MRASRSPGAAISRHTGIDVAGTLLAGLRAATCSISDRRRGEGDLLGQALRVLTGLEAGHQRRAEAVLGAAGQLRADLARSRRGR